MSTNDSIEVLRKRNAYLSDRLEREKSRVHYLNDVIKDVWRSLPKDSDLKKPLEKIVIDCAKSSY